MKMENLRDLKDVITVVYAKMISEVPMRSDLASFLVDMTKSSLLTFTASYKQFEQTIGSSEDLYAHWLNTQLQVMTLLDGDDALLTRHAEAVYKTLLGTSGGPSADIFPQGNDKKKELPDPPLSVKMALAFRVFLDNIDVIAAPPPPGTQTAAQQGAKQ